MGRRFSGFITKFLFSEDEPATQMEIGTPYNFQHIQHVKADPHTSTGFAVSIQQVSPHPTLIHY
jgi:hypothetical protein